MPQSNTPRHQPVDSLKSPRFSGVRTFMRLPHVRDLQHADAAVFGVPFDTGTSFRPGARFGPAAIRDASSILKPYCPLTEVDIVEHLSIVDYGDIDTVPGYFEDSNAAIEAGMAELCRAGVVPVAMGGRYFLEAVDFGSDRPGPRALPQSGRNQPKSRYGSI